MNIKRAKEEIRNSVKAYLTVNERGEYMVPSIRQRPILLMGPPGIGKTAIMEQVARECGVALVSYTITHHTRQSAVGLPFIEKMTYNQKEYSVTEYTMSEIIASVYDKMNQTGLKQGILFIDEINCVSETLAPTMLQFLQQKMFGNHKVPEGWIIVTAGNPPEYNKSVREFDIVTLDRLKRMDIEADYEVWKEYAYINQIHGAVMSYLELKKDNFYDVRTTIDGKIFVTARGWEDLSGMIKAYEKLGYKIDAEFIYEYLQHPTIAKDFSNYYDLYLKYQKEYKIEDILAGHVAKSAYDRIRLAAFDERYSIVSHLISGLTTAFAEYAYETDYVSAIFEKLKIIKEKIEVNENIGTVMKQEISETQAVMEMQKEAGILEGDELSEKNKALKFLKDIQLYSDFEDVKSKFNIIKDEMQKNTNRTEEKLNNSFEFIITAFGESQELIMFVTEISLNYYALRFINEIGNAKYTFYVSKYLSGDRNREIMSEIESLNKE